MLKLGEKLYLKHGHDRELFGYIRNTLRELGRLLLHLRKAVGPVDAGLEHFINPQMFRDVVCSARAVSGFSEETHQYTTPSLALKLGISLKKCAKIVKGKAMEIGDDQKKEQAHSFSELCEMNWMDEVSTHALRTLSENRRNKVKLLPLTQDVLLLTKHLRTEGNAAFQKLQSEDDISAWCTLNEATLAQVILFNRRRQGEASKMKLEDFRGQHSASQEDVMDSLSPLEQKLCQTLQRIEIIGKRGRVVPLILTAEVKKWIDRLIAKRECIGVHSDNKYVFARAYYGSLGHIQGCHCLKDSSEKCGAKLPKLLRSTKLRKQIGTLSQIMNLKDHELDILANFLGHDIRVHRRFYRLPEETIQVAKVSKVLLALETGQIKELRGKNLDEIQVDLEEEIDVEVNLDGESDASDKNDQEEDIQHNPGNQSDRKRKLQDQQDDISEDDCQLDRHNRTPVETAAGQPVKKRLWSLEERAAVMRHFEGHVVLGKIPVKREVDRCLAREPSLKHRTWRNIKDYVRNKIKTSKSKQVF